MAISRGRYFSWISRDGEIILLTNGLRSFAYGFVSIILAIYLSTLGFNAFWIGVIITLILICGAFTTVLASIYADRIGRRRFLFITGMLMAVSGLIFALTSNSILIFVAALSGAMSPSGSDVSAFLSLEQAMLPQAGTREKRHSIYAVYNTVGQFAGSAGILFSASPVLFQSLFHVGTIESYKPMFAIYSVIAVIMSVCYLLISSKMELQAVVSSNGGAIKQVSRMSHHSRMIIAKFSSLLAVDALAGGFVIQTIMAYWFHQKFSVPLEYISLVFFVTGVFASFSLLAAGKLASKIGAINTMFFTHLPANILLILVPLAPSLYLALSFYVARSLITQMDVPARQAYTMSVVSPNERTAASGFTNISRNVARIPSPTISGYALQFVSLALPFFVAGTIYIFSDSLLYISFRKVKERGENEGRIES